MPAPGRPKPESPARTRADRSARKRDAVLGAATSLFLSSGFLATSVEQIALAAGVSKPTVYTFFADKESLLTEIVLATLDRAGEPFRARLAELGDSADLAGDLPQMARGYLATVMQPSVLRLRRLVIGVSPQLPGLARAYYERAPERTLDALAACFARLADRGLLRPGDPLMAAGHFAFLVLGRALDKSLFCGDRPFTHAELTAQADAGAAAFLAVYARPVRGTARSTRASD